MSLLDDYEELCNAQDIGIFRDTLDETLKPILIILEERYFKVNRMLDDLNIKIKDLRDEMESRLGSMDTKIEHELNYAYETHNTKLHNMWRDMLKIQSDLESIKLSLKK
jgi:hypothetical protein